MNVKAYYQKIQEFERALSEPFVVIVSRDTADGGRGGLLTEVSKQLAARMITDGRAHLASAEAAREFREKSGQAKRSAEELFFANRSQVTLAPTVEMRKSTRTPRE